MATAANIVMHSAKRQRIRRRRQPPKFVVMHGDRELDHNQGVAMLARVSDAIAQRSTGLHGRVARLPSAPERASIARAMIAVEERLVKAFWTIARQPMLGSLGPTISARNGVGYTHEGEDTHARYADAPGGKWEAVAPRPALPSSREIDAATRALDWLLLVDERRRKILVVGATSKRGDAGRNISWSRLRKHLPEFGNCTTRTLQDRYRQGLREIVTELTIARIVTSA